MVPDGGDWTALEQAHLSWATGLLPALNMFETAGQGESAQESSRETESKVACWLDTVVGCLEPQHEGRSHESDVSLGMQQIPGQPELHGETLSSPKPHA